MNLYNLSDNKDTHRRVDGYALGSPDGDEIKGSDDLEIRRRLELDDVIEKAIQKIPPAGKLYPEVYAWSVTDAVVSYFEGMLD